MPTTIKWGSGARGLFSGKVELGEAVQDLVRRQYDFRETIERPVSCLGEKEEPP